MIKIKAMRTNTVAGVLHVFRAAIESLKEIEKAQKAESSRQYSLMSQAEKKAIDASNEADEAAAIRANLEALING